MPSRCDIPSENPPAFLPATFSRPTMWSTSSTLREGMPLAIAIQFRCFHADRAPCTALASSRAPTFLVGFGISR